MMRREIPWDLLISHFKQETGQEEEKALLDWRKQPDQEKIYRELRSVWEQVLNSSQGYTLDADYYWKQFEKRIEQKRPVPVPLRTFRIALVAASVLLILGVGLAYWGGKNLPSSPEEILQSYTTLNGKSRMVLPDGSLVWLHAGSTLNYKTTFTENRELFLEGEALFEVERKDGKPFFVRTGEITVEVHGTRFNVEAYQDNPEIKVSLIHGSVSVGNGGERLMMSPGDRVSFHKEERIFTLQKEDMFFESSWANESYSFEAKTLEYICRYLERWYHVEIKLDPSIATTQVYTFTLTDEPLETILQIMSGLSPIQYTFTENKKIEITQVKPSKK
ncbi:MAG: FecR domain-containing protein [Tannerellaceae bacterium]|nr:FecR domain-containing protein [Tannerellaceae bacterium]